MFVCFCKGVTDTDIRRAAENGVTDLKGLRKELGLGTQCGKCSALAVEVLDDARRCEVDPSPGVQYFGLA